MNDVHDPWAIEYIQTRHNFVKYRPSAVPGIGEIYEHGFKASGFIEEDRAKGLPVVIVDEAPTLERHYVDIGAGKMLPKQPSPVVLDGSILRKLPPGAVILIDGAEYSVGGDKEAELSFDLPGAYRVEVRAPAHLPAVFEVVKP